MIKEHHIHKVTEYYLLVQLIIVELSLLCALEAFIKDIKNITNTR